MRGAPPFAPNDVVMSDHRIPPFLRDETLLVGEVRNIGTRGNPHWRVHVRSSRGIEGWLDATSLILL
jgi:hypothetical protein